MRFSTILVALVACALPATACKPSAPAATQPEAAASGSASPHGSARAHAPEETVPPMRGTVLETMDVANYTYLHMQTGTEKVWAAVPRCKVAVGDVVVVERAMPMRDFKSPTLNRTFDTIYFGVMRGAIPPDPAASASAPAASAAASAPPAPAPAPAGSLAVPDKISVPKAKGPGAATVDDILKDPAKLAGKPVVVHAMVVKVNAGILERNWVHVKDGTGGVGGKIGDLLVTTHDVPRVGEVVTVRGKVAVDKDFGSGYSYKVLVEEATIAADPAK
jgi:hypothetical protein